MKIIRCDICDCIIWDRKVVKKYYKFQYNNICPNCKAYGTLRRTKIKRRVLKDMLKRALKSEEEE